MWPIFPGSERRPANWPGWPEGKKFAFVLTHDVEGAEGVGKCRAVMELEKRFGFRSSFNLIPEGEYPDVRELREALVSEGFEVGVHDLHHDGKLYRSKTDFQKHAAQINKHLKAWDARGFRSGFMLHNLDWLHELNIDYDASTFDTDPFEPQPQGKHTIFPFWVPRPASAISRDDGEPVGGSAEAATGRRNGYVELPYTLAQDSTLFLLLQERSPSVWLEKLDWVAKNGGMVLLDTHPDYMGFTGTRKKWEYPAEMYTRLLEYVRDQYEGQYWHALPNQVAHFYRASLGEKTTKPKEGKPVPARTAVNKKPKIWIDLDNTPHVPFFEPIMDELQARGYPVLVTARDAFQVCELADKKGMRYIKVGRHHGKSPLLKVSGLFYRAWQLAGLIARERPVLGVSHGARSQLLLGTFLRVPTLLLEDYEFASFPPMMRPTWVMAPSVIPDSALCGNNGNIRKYSGIKEDVYAWKFKPDAALMSEIGARETDLIVTVRPPATEAHYHNPESEQFFEAFMNRACDLNEVKVVLLPRNKKQGDAIRQQWPQWFEGSKTVIPERALDGMNLIWHSDLVVSGGGTMNREAAALGVPVYSIFRGRIGAVDKYLKAEQRLVLIESVADVQNRVSLVKRQRKSLAEVTSRKTLEEVVTAIEEIAARAER